MLKEIDQRILSDPLYLVRSGALGDVLKLQEGGPLIRAAGRGAFPGSDPEFEEAIRRSKLDQRR